jgi:hypothetical protein
MNERGRLIDETRITRNSPMAFAQFFQSLDERSGAVQEGARNRGCFYDLLLQIERGAEV